MANKLNIGLSAVATGTANAITASYSPAITLTDRRIVFLRITTPNTSTTPTLNPNSLGAKTITKLGGDPLNAGDLQGDCILMYDLTNTRWELITAKASIVSPDGLKTVVTTDSFARLLATNSATIEAYIFADLLKAQLYYYDDDNAGGNVYIDKDRLTLTHDLLVNVVATDFRLSSETASRVAILDANKNVKGADTATYPSLTELSYVKGATSSIQTQLNGKYRSETFFTTSNQSVADGGVYIFGQTGAPVNVASSASKVPVLAGTVVAVSTSVFSASTIGSSEGGTLKFFYNDGTNSITLATDFKVDANRSFFRAFTGLSTAINDGDCYIEYTAPTLATNPAAIRWMVTVYIK